MQRRPALGRRCRFWHHLASAQIGRYVESVLVARAQASQRTGDGLLGGAPSGAERGVRS